MAVSDDSTRTDMAFERFTQILDASGAREALAYIVGLSEYRCIGIFRFHDGMADAAIHYDREEPACLRATEVDDVATYCCYVRDSRGLFATADARKDDRLRDHPARNVVLAYSGVPILDPEGAVLGTLCHYDFVPHDPNLLDLELLVQVVSALQQGDHIPPYPGAIEPGVQVP